MNMTVDDSVVKKMMEEGVIQPIPEVDTMPFKELPPAPEGSKHFWKVYREIKELSYKIAKEIAPEKNISESLEWMLGYVLGLEILLGQTKPNNVDFVVWENRFKAASVLLSLQETDGLQKEKLEKAVSMMNEFIEDHPDSFPNLHMIGFSKENGILDLFDTYREYRAKYAPGHEWD